MFQLLTQKQLAHLRGYKATAARTEYHTICASLNKKYLTVRDFARYEGVKVEEVIQALKV